MSEITASEQIRLDIIKKVNYDTAAAKLAIDWVSGLAVRQLQRYRDSAAPITRQARTFPVMSAAKTGSIPPKWAGRHPAPGWIWPRRRRTQTTLSQTA